MNSEINDFNGGDERTWTADLLSARQAFSQLNYIPTQVYITLKYLIKKVDFIDQVYIDRHLNALLDIKINTKRVCW